MTVAIRIGGWALGAVLCWSLACSILSCSSDDELERGGLGDLCYLDGTCDDELFCNQNTCEVLAAPTDVQTIPQDHSIRLTWNSPYDPVDFQVLRRKSSESAFEVLAPSTGEERSYEDLDILLGKTYEYVIHAVKSQVISPPSDIVSAEALEPPKDWTLIYFISSDGNYNYDYMFNIEGLQAQGGSTERLNVISLYDGYPVGDTVYFVVGDSAATTESNPPPTESDGEVNMGDVQSYYDFIDWMLPQYTASHYFVSFHNHGGGAIQSGMSGSALGQPQNILFDETSGDSLDPDEQADIVAYLAQRTEQPVEVVETMTCLGQMIENTYGMIGQAHYHVSAESYSYVTGTFPIRFLTQNPDSDAADLAQFIAQDHYEGVVAQSSPCHWSILNLDELDALVGLLQTLTGELLAWTVDTATQELLRDVAARAQHFGMSTSELPAAYVDIKDLAYQIVAQASLPLAVREIAQEIIDLFDAGALIPYNAYHNDTHPGMTVYSDYSRAFGLSIYHPNTNRPYYDEDAAPPYEELSFTLATNWADYLRQISLPKPSGLCAPVSDLSAELLVGNQVRIRWNYSTDHFPQYDGFFCSRDKDGVWTGEYYTVAKSADATQYEVLDTPVASGSGTFTYRVSPFRGTDEECYAWSTSNPVVIP